MNYTSKLFQRSTDQLGSAKMKQQLYMVLIVAGALLIAVRGGQMVGAYLHGEAAPTEVAATVPTVDAQTVESQPAETSLNGLTTAADAPQVDGAALSDGATNANETSPTAVAVPAQLAAADEVTEPTTVVVLERVVVIDAAEPADDVSPAIDEQAADMIAPSDETDVTEQPQDANSSRDAVVRVFAALGSNVATESSAASSGDASDSGVSDAETMSIIAQDDPAYELNSLQIFAAQLATHVRSPEESTAAATVPTQATARQAVVFLFRGPFHAFTESPATDAATEVESVNKAELATPQDYAHEPAETVAQTESAAEANASAVDAKDSQIAESAIETTSTEDTMADATDAAAVTDEAISQAVGGTNEQSTSPATDEAPAADGPTGVGATVELLLVNPSESTGPIRYLVNGHEFSMPPGHSQHLPVGREWRVKFHPGGDYADVELSLRSGTYEFRASNAGWRLSAVDGTAAP